MAGRFDKLSDSDLNMNKLLDLPTKQLLNWLWQNIMICLAAQLFSSVFAFGK